MYEIDRMLVIVKPTIALVDWINKDIPYKDDKATLDMVSTDCTSLLIPEFDDYFEAEKYIEDIYLDIFEAELESWSLDKTTWPQNRSYELFREWFDLEFHSLVFDASDVELFESEFEVTTIQ